jgi:hypothetical protein
MGMYLTVNVGFYFHVKKQLKEISNTVSTCINKQCDTHGKWSNQKFCSECGSEVQSLTSVKTESIACPSKLLPEEFEDSICSFEGLDDTFWVFNFSIAEEDKYCRSFDRYSEEKALEIPYFEINEKINSLKENDEEIKRIMKYMNDTYGENSIDLKYGVFSYYC